MNPFRKFLNKVKVVTAKEAEQCDFLVCVRTTTPALFDDDETGSCSQCGAEVRFRPHAPKSIPRMCMECFMEVNPR